MFKDLVPIGNEDWSPAAVKFVSDLVVAAVQVEAKILDKISDEAVVGKLKFKIDQSKLGDSLTRFRFLVSNAKEFELTRLLEMAEFGSLKTLAKPRNRLTLKYCESLPKQKMKKKPDNKTRFEFDTVDYDKKKSEFNEKLEENEELRKSLGKLDIKDDSEVQIKKRESDSDGEYYDSYEN